MESTRCAQCQGDMQRSRAHSTPGGELLCGPCFLYLYGPRRQRSRPMVGVRTATPRRPTPIRPVWLTPSPTADASPGP